MAAIPKLVALLALAGLAPGGPPGLDAATPCARASARRCVGASVPRSSEARVPRAVGAPDSVRQLNVAIVLLTNSFNKVLTTAEVERVHEEVAEFYAFYQQHGAGKVDF